LARPGGRDSDGGVGDYRDSAVVNSLIKKLRPNDRSYGSSSSFSSPSSFTRPTSRTQPARSPMRPGAVWGCVSLGVLLGIALPQWPYERACGSWLLLYLTAVMIVVLAGTWASRVTWTSRIGPAHFLAVCTIIWGLALTAHEVLPRVGYAKTRLAWRCHDGHALAWPKLTPLFTVKEPK
jgi:hypothetical protein